jgi:three-Cys-motif partner protein
MTIIPMNGYVPKYLPIDKREPRESGSYAQIKIDAFTAYCAAAQHVFKTNRSKGITGCLLYFEPFSGPGMNEIRETKKRVKGTALLAIERLTYFDVFVFNELKPKILNALYSELVDLGLDADVKRTIYLSKQDANQTVSNLRTILPKKQVGVAFPVMGVAVVDPPGMNFTWSAVMELSRHRLDFVGMLSTSHDLTRNLDHVDGHAHLVDWLGENPIGTPTQVLARYEEKLRTVAKYEHVHGPTSSPLPGQQDMGVPRAYHLFLATKCKSEVASRIWKGVCKSVSKGTRGNALFDEADFK